MASKKETKAGKKDFDLILAPVFTEKTTMLGSLNKSAVAFKVKTDATKTEIKGAVERIFNVEVSSLRTCNYSGKLKRMSRDTGKRSDYKKAYVTLKEGHSIDLVEGF